jgi:hypothetical protein
MHHSSLPPSRAPLPSAPVTCASPVCPRHVHLSRLPPSRVPLPSAPVYRSRPLLYHTPALTLEASVPSRRLYPQGVYTLKASIPSRRLYPQGVYTLKASIPSRRLYPQGVYTLKASIPSRRPYPQGVHTLKARTGWACLRSEAHAGCVMRTRREGIAAASRGRARACPCRGHAPSAS